MLNANLKNQRTENIKKRVLSVHSGPSARKALAWRQGGWVGGKGRCRVSKEAVEHLLNSILKARTNLQKRRTGP